MFSSQRLSGERSGCTTCVSTPKVRQLGEEWGTCTLEEDMDRVWEEMRMADDVRIRRQFRAYSGRQEDLQVGDYVYAAVLPAVTDSRKLSVKWSGPLVIQERINETMFRVKEIRVKSPRVYTAHPTKLRLAKCGGKKGH